MKRTLHLIFLMSFCFVNFTYAKDFYTVEAVEAQGDVVVLTVQYDLDGIPVKVKMPVVYTYMDSDIEQAIKNRAASEKSALPGGAAFIDKRARVDAADAAQKRFEAKINEKVEIR